MQYNGNAWHGEMAMCKFLQRPVRKPHAVCGQEVKLSGEELGKAKKDAQYHGWTCSFSPAVVTKGSLHTNSVPGVAALPSDNGDRRYRSAGTMVATPSHVGSELLWPFGREDLSPVEAPGR